VLPQSLDNDLADELQLICLTTGALINHPLTICGVVGGGGTLAIRRNFLLCLQALIQAARVALTRRVAHRVCHFWQLIEIEPENSSLIYEQKNA
jgi:hypothetical protein